MTGQKRADGRRSGRIFTLFVTVATATALFAVMGSSSADVTAVKGSAFGVSVPNLTLFGGAQTPFPPTPSVTLATNASNSPQSASAPTLSVQYGPARIFSSGPATVNTQGTLGAGGSVTSTATFQTINTSGQEVFTATGMSSTCTANESGVSGSTTVTGGTVQISENTGPGGTPVVVPVPVNPAPNTIINGALETIGDTFQFIFNEQTIAPDGTITVTALHERLLGPTAVGDVYIGQVVCDVTATVVTTTTTTTRPTTTTSTTNPSTTTTSTTTPASTTSTTRPSSTTTTTRPSGFSCDGKPATIVGTPGPDTLVGTSGPDVIVGRGGNDYLIGLEGNDTICGGPNQDNIDAGAGDDTVFAGAGVDKISGGPGNDTVYGQQGNDQLVSGGGVNLLNGGADFDQCVGNATTTFVSCENIA